jgi:hypothetical protein
VSLSGLTSPLAAGSVSATAGLPVPRYPAETADRDRGVARWIPGLPVIVAGLAGRWSLRVGEPFQPGGQCSWTAPVTGPRSADLVLKIAFRFPGGEERAEAAALAAQPEPWLVIDPNPYVGDPAYDLLLHMLNCEDRLAAHPAGLANRVAALAGIDAHRVRQWLSARGVQKSIGSPLMCQVGGAARARLTRRHRGDINLALDDTLGTRIWTLVVRVGRSEFAM